jgi:phenylacetic acid degradation operon negative regulatory protein
VTLPAGDALSAQPRALIVTIYGLYAREAGGWLSISALIRLMAELGADEPAVRSAISRLKQRGLLEPRRIDGAAGYALSGRGRSILAEGDLRIFQQPRAAAGDGWLLAVFSVPEDRRSRRHALRSRLAWLGFGSVAAGVWIAPAQLAEQTRQVLADDGLAEYVTLFTAGHLAFGDVRDQVSRWWDLDRLEELYQAFIDSAAPLLARWASASEQSAGEQSAGEQRAGKQGAGADADENEQGQAFADYVRLLTAWRRLPFLDPGLPAELLPGNWHGARAAELFTTLSALLSGLARDHVAAVTGQLVPPGS